MAIWASATHQQEDISWIWTFREVTWLLEAEVHISNCVCRCCPVPPCPTREALTSFVCLVSHLY